MLSCLHSVLESTADGIAAQLVDYCVKEEGLSSVDCVERRAGNLAWRTACKSVSPIYNVLLLWMALSMYYLEIMLNVCER